MGAGRESSATPRGSLRRMGGMGEEEKKRVRHIARKWFELNRQEALDKFHRMGGDSSEFRTDMDWAPKLRQ
jgi:hypothetical protein